MRYGLRDLEVDDLQQTLKLAPEETGLGVFLRKDGRLVGFPLVEPKDGSRTIQQSDLLNDEVGAALACEAIRLRERPAPGPAPSLTVAICSKDRWDWVDRLLASLEPFRLGDSFEILVVDNASSDHRMMQVCQSRGVRYVREDLVGLNFARNRALREATGEVVAYLDDDVTVDRNWLSAMRDAWARHPDAGCITGLVLPMLLDTEAQILFERRGGFRRGFLPMRFKGEEPGDPLFPCGAGRFGAGANMSLRRSLLLDLGAFDEALDTGRPLPGGGDLDVFYRVLRAGAALVYEPQAAVFHEHRRDLEILRRQYYTWGLGFCAFVMKSMRTDRAMRWRFRRLLLWWMSYQVRRIARRMLDRDPTPLRMIWGEIWGGVVGLAGEYERSLVRIAAIRGAAAK